MTRLEVMRERNHLASQLSQKDLIRFWSKASVLGDDDCWLWLACRAKTGYGRFRLSGHTFNASHLSALMKHGIPPEDKYAACHKCDNPPCVNPSHLFWGDDRDNVLDASCKKRLKHQRVPIFQGEGNPQAKLTDRLVRRIRSSNKTQQQLADELGVSRSLIGYVRQRKIWSHV